MQARESIFTLPGRQAGQAHLAEEAVPERIDREEQREAEEPEAMIATYRNAADKGLHTNTTILSNYKPAYTVDWSSLKGHDWTEPYDAAVPLKTLKALSKQSKLQQKD